MITRMRMRADLTSAPKNENSESSDVDEVDIEPESVNWIC
jgi:hypothetical protein